MPFCGTKWANDFTSFFTEYLGYPKCYSIKNYHHRTIFLTSSCADCLIWSNYCIMLVVYGYSSSHTLYLRWIGPLRMTGSDVTGSDVSHVTGSDVSHCPGSMFCACATGSCAISTLVGPFWTEVTPVTWPEVVLTGSRFCACPTFFLVVVTWLPDVTEGHLIPLGFLCVCAHAQLPNIRSDRRSRDPLRKCPWGVLYDVQMDTDIP